MSGPRGTRATVTLLVVLALCLSGCGWRGLNSLPLPGTAGGGPGSYTIEVQLPDATTLQQNSRVRVGDVTIGNVDKIERQGWHALLTLRLAADVDLPANASAKLGQSSLLGTVYVGLGPPISGAPEGKLHQGSLIPLSSAGMYPTTEQTLSAVSLLLNGGGIGQIQDITASLSTAFAGREQDLRSLIGQLDKFVTYLNDQSGDIISATDKVNNLVGQFAADKPVVDRALRTIPDALAVLDDERAHLADAVDKLGKLAALTSDAVHQTKDSLVAELRQLGPVLESLANSGPAMTRSLSQLLTFPWPNETIDKWFRGDYANLSAVLDFTLSRVDQSLFTGTRFEGNLTELEFQWGRTIGQMPSPYTARDPLIAPYREDQGP